MHTTFFQIAGVVLTGLGTALFLALPLGVAGWLGDLYVLVGVNPYTFYLTATGGSVMLGWGASLLWAATSSDETRRVVAMASGVAFTALSLMRVFSSLTPDEEFDPARAVMAVESVLFLVAGMLFFNIGCSVFARLADAWRSFRSIKTWVFIWVNLFLAPVNLAAFAIYAVTGHPIAMWAAIGFAFVLVANMTTALYERGISKITSAPHLIPWIPLLAYMGDWLFFRTEELQATPLIHNYAIALFIINGISVLFDLFDTYRWIAGDRNIASKAA